MTSFRIVPALAFGAWCLALIGPASAQAPPAPAPAEPPAAKTAEAPAESQKFESRQALDAYYGKQFQDLRNRWFADLGALASRQDGDEAEATYQALFNQAISTGQFALAQPAAEEYLQRKEVSTQNLATATFVDILARADRGEDTQSLQTLAAFLKGRPGTNEKIDPGTLYTVGETFLQRLIRSGRYATARKVCQLMIDSKPDPAVRDHFAARLARFNMLGKAAPAMDATDVDGQPVSLADLKGKVVLVDFWASWAPASVSLIPAYKALFNKYQGQGFEIVAVNMDSARKGAGDANQIADNVRQLLVAYDIPWINVINASGKADIAKAYGVTSLPANFLIDKTGKIIQVEQYGPELEKDLAEVLGGGTAPGATQPTEAEPTKTEAAPKPQPEPKKAERRPR